MGKKSKSKSKKKAQASASVPAAPSNPPTSRPPAPRARAPAPAKNVGANSNSSSATSRPTMKERDGARIERAARQFVSSNGIIENQIENPSCWAVAPGWYPDKESVLATALSDKHEAMLAKMLAYDQKVHAWQGLILTKSTLCT